MKKILVIDDDENILHLVSILMVRAGHEVITANNGLLGLTTALRVTPDLIICDVMMPQMSGIEVVRRLKVEPTTQHIPVIMLTARVGETDVSDSLYYGVDLHMAKPFNPAELTSFVDRILRPEHIPET